MRFNEIHEGTMARRYASSRRTPMEETEIIERIRSECSDALAATPILRGTRKSRGTENFAKINTVGSQPRLSANTRSYVGLIMDNLDVWQSYPKRSQSLICTSGYTTASWYGDQTNVYRVFPVNGTKIAVCPDEDVWFSFKLPEMSNNISNFNDTLDLLSKKILHQRLDETNFKSFTDDLTIIENWLKNPEYFAQLNAKEKGRANMLMQTLGTPFVDGLSKVFDPTTNGFTLTDISSLNVPKSERAGMTRGKEIWFSGTAYIVRLFQSEKYFRTET